MSIEATDLVLYGSAVMADDDATTGQGGAIDETVLVAFTDISPTGPVEASSSASGDTTQTLTVTGRLDDGSIVSEAKTLNGQSWVDFTTSFERILKVVVSAAHTGTITVREDVSQDTLITIPSGVLEVRRLFYNATSDVLGGSTKNYYEKVFFKNEHATLALTDAQVEEAADGTSRITFALEDSLDGTDSCGANTRLTMPSGYSAGDFTGVAKTVANSGSLSAGSAQGIWLELELEAGAASTKSTYTLRLRGVTT